MSHRPRLRPGLAWIKPIKPIWRRLVGQKRVGAQRRWRPVPSICARDPAALNAPMHGCELHGAIILKKQISQETELESRSTRPYLTHLTKDRQTSAVASATGRQFRAHCSAPTRQKGWADRLMEETENRVIERHVRSFGRVTAPSRPRPRPRWYSTT